MIQHFREALTVAQVAASAGLNTEYAMRLFQQRWKLTIWTFLQQQRIAEGRRLLGAEGHSIAEIAFASGFQSLSRFYAVFQQQCGCSPSVYRRRIAAGSI